MAIGNPPLPAEFSNRVTLSCSATVGGERVYAQTWVVEAVYNDPDARKMLRAALRQMLMDKILEKWTPVVKVERSGLGFGAAMGRTPEA